MTGRPTDPRMGPRSAATLGLVLLGWLGAQVLVLGIAERISALTGSEVMHRHASVDVVAMVLITGMASATLVIAMRVRMPRRSAPAPDSRMGATQIVPAALALVLLTAAETSELAFLAHHHAAPVIVLLVVAAFLQGVAALAAAYAWSAVVRAIVRSRALSHPGEQRTGRPKAAVAVRAYGLQPVHWIGTLTPERAPPALLAC